MLSYKVDDIFYILLERFSFYAITVHIILICYIYLLKCQ